MRPMHSWLFAFPLLALISQPSYAAKPFAIDALQAPNSVLQVAEGCKEIDGELVCGKKGKGAKKQKERKKGGKQQAKEPQEDGDAVEDGGKQLFKKSNKKGQKNKDDDKNGGNNDDDDKAKNNTKNEPVDPESCAKAQCDPGEVQLEKRNMYGACCEAREGLCPKDRPYGKPPKCCAYGTTWREGGCYPTECPPGMKGTPPHCTRVCPSGQVNVNETCTRACPSGSFGGIPPNCDCRAEWKYFDTAAWECRDRPIREVCVILEKKSPDQDMTDTLKSTIDCAALGGSLCKPVQPGSTQYNCCCHKYTD